MLNLLRSVKAVVWDFECKYIGIWKAGKRWCSLKRSWVKKDECEMCEIYDDVC